MWPLKREKCLFIMLSSRIKILVLDCVHLECVGFLVFIEERTVGCCSRLLLDQKTVHEWARKLIHDPRMGIMGGWMMGLQAQTLERL